MGNKDNTKLLNLSLLGAVKLTSLACGNQHVWACDTSGGVYFRVGTQPLNPSLMLPAWIMIEPPIQVNNLLLLLLTECLTVCLAWKWKHFYTFF